MPLEVRQIGIRLAIGDAGDAPPPDASGGDGAPRLTRTERARLVEECVRAVVAELRAERER